MFGNQTVLNRMAMRITVGDVSSPFLTSFPAQTTASEARRIWEEVCQSRLPSNPEEHVALVTEGSQPIGTVGFIEMLQQEQSPVRDCMEPLSWDAVVSAETPLIEAAKLFRKESPYLFAVLRGNRLTDYLSYQCLLSQPFRACLFSMILGVEELLLSVIDTDVGLAVSKAPLSRIKRLLKKHAKDSWRDDRILNRAIVKDLYFSEKLSIIASCHATASQIASLSVSYEKRKKLLTPTHSKNDKAFRLRSEQLKEIRNRLAHPTESWRLSMLLPKEDLGDFLTWLSRLETELTEYLELGHKLSD